MRNILILSAMLIIMLAACGGNDAPALRGADQINDTPVPSELETRLTGYTGLQFVTDRTLSGRLMFTHNGNLQVVAFDDEEPVQTFAEDVSIAASSPDGSVVIYNDHLAGESFVLDIKTGETRVIGDKASFVVAQYASDGQVVLLHELATIDSDIIWRHVVFNFATGNDIVLPIPPKNVDETDYFIEWLSDGRILVLLGTSTPRGVRADGYIIDPFNKEQTSFSLEGSAALNDFYRRVQSYYSGFGQNSVASLEAYALQNFDLSVSFTVPSLKESAIFDPGYSYGIKYVLSASRDLCRNYDLALKPMGAVFFPITIHHDIVANISNLVLQSGLDRIAWVDVLAPNCDDSVVVQRLWRANVSEELSGLAIFRTKDLGGMVPQPAIVANPYDPQLVIWSVHSITDQRASLMLTDLRTGKTQEIMRLPYDNETDKGFGELVWVTASE